MYEMKNPVTKVKTFPVNRVDKYKKWVELKARDIINVMQTDKEIVVTYAEPKKKEISIEHVVKLNNSFKGFVPNFKHKTNHS